MARRRQARGTSWWKSIPNVVKEVTALLTAIAGLVGGLVALGVIGGGNDGDKGGKAETNTTERVESGLPTVVRFVSEDPDFSERGFFTPRGGYIVSTQGALRATRVVWTAGEHTQEAEVRRVALGNQEAAAAVLFELTRAEAPPAGYATRVGLTLEKGEPVRGYLGPEQLSPATVKATRRSWRVEGYGMVPNLIITTSLGIPGEGGAPLLDAENKVVGMVFADAETLGETGSIAIEAIRKEFPDAF